MRGWLVQGQDGQQLALGEQEGDEEEGDGQRAFQALRRVLVKAICGGRRVDDGLCKSCRLTPSVALSLSSSAMGRRLGVDVPQLRKLIPPES